MFTFSFKYTYIYILYLVWLSDMVWIGCYHTFSGLTSESDANLLDFWPSKPKLDVWPSAQPAKIGCEKYKFDGISATTATTFLLPCLHVWFTCEWLDYAVSLIYGHNDTNHKSTFTIIPHFFGFIVSDEIILLLWEFIGNNTDKNNISCHHETDPSYMIWFLLSNHLASLCGLIITLVTIIHYPFMFAFVVSDHMTMFIWRESYNLLLYIENFCRVNFCKPFKLYPLPTVVFIF